MRCSWLAVDLNAAIVGPHQLADDGQPEAGTTLDAGARAVAAPGPGEDVAQVVGSDAHAGVADLKDRRLAVSPDAQLHLAPGFRVVACVRE